MSSLWEEDCWRDLWWRWDHLLRWADDYREWTFWGLLVLGLAAGAIAPLVRKAVRGLNCCPACGYDLRGLRSSACPECGGGVSGLEPAAVRPSARLCAWLRGSLVRRAVLGAITVLPAAWLARDALDVHQRGWVALTPSILLVYLAETNEEPYALRPREQSQSCWEGELSWRLWSFSRWRRSDRSCFGSGRVHPSMWAWEREIWLKRCVARSGSGRQQDFCRPVETRVYRVPIPDGARLPESLDGKVIGQAALEMGRWYDLREDDYASRVAERLDNSIRKCDWSSYGGNACRIDQVCTHLVITTDRGAHALVRAWLDRLAGMSLGERVSLLRRDDETEEAQGGTPNEDPPGAE